MAYGSENIALDEYKVDRSLLGSIHCIGIASLEVGTPLSLSGRIGKHLNTILNHLVSVCLQCLCFSRARFNMLEQTLDCKIGLVDGNLGCSHCLVSIVLLSASEPVVVLTSPAGIQNWIVFLSGRALHCQTISVLCICINKFGPNVSGELVSIIKLGVALSLHLIDSIGKFLAELNRHLGESTCADKIPTTKALTNKLKRTLLDDGIVNATATRGNEFIKLSVLDSSGTAVECTVVYFLQLSLSCCIGTGNGKRLSIHKNDVRLTHNREVDTAGKLFCLVTVNFCAVRVKLVHTYTYIKTVADLV